MGNVNWVILGFRPEKCTQFFLGPRTSDFRPHYRNPYIKGPKRQFFIDFFDFFEFFEGPGPGVRERFGRMGNVNWVILGFRSEKCTQFFLGPRTSDFRPDYGNLIYKGPQKVMFQQFFNIFSVFFRANRGGRE